MKIHNLEITGFGPFAGSEVLDFESLDRAGLFLLTGPTGSGKTTVLDAICFAIYGKLPRSGGKQPDPASDYRDTGLTPKVVLEVTIGGNRLRIARVPKHMRPKKSGEGLTPDGNTVAVEELTGGEWKTVSTTLSEANADLEGRVGMDAAQFSQVVMLPQGEFATFLKATVDQRRALLERLFPTQDLAYVEDWLKRRSQETAKDRSDKLEEITHCLVAADAVIEGLIDEDEQPLDSRPEALDGEKIPAWQQSVTSHLERERDQAASAEKASSDLLASADAEHGALKAKAELVTRRIEAETTREQLMAGADEQKVRLARIAAAEKARTVSPLSRIAQTALERKEQAAAESKLITEKLWADPAIDDLDPKALESKMKSLRIEATTLSNFEDKELPEMKSLASTVEVSEAGLKELSGTGSGPGAALAARKAELLEAESASVTAKRNLIEIRKARTAGMAAELAAKLEPDAPCMVCGSLEHPSPAVALEHAPTEIDEKDASDAVPAAEKQEKSLRAEHDALQASLEGRRVKLKADLGSAQKRLKALSENETALKAGAATIAERLELVEDTAELISDGLNCEGKRATAVKAHAESEAQANKEAKNNGFDSLDAAAKAMLSDEALEGLKAASREHQEGLATVSHQLTEGDLSDVDPKSEFPLEGAEQTFALRRSEHNKAIGTHATASKRLEDFRNQCSAIPKLIEQLAPLSEEARRAGELSDLANGRNRHKMELSIYVLAARLKQVIEAANRRLEPMSNGQYELVYSDGLSGHGAASGLGIQIYDSHTSATRDTVTLSGGESFYASLALALGLAEVVQRETGGRKIETLFIDEGFGTLDPETLDQVMNEIDSLRENGRTVGLVSHVEELRNRIPTQIRVSKSGDGSTTELVGA